MTSSGFTTRSMQKTNENISIFLYGLVITGIFALKNKIRSQTVAGKDTGNISSVFFNFH